MSSSDATSERMVAIWLLILVIFATVPAELAGEPGETVADLDVRDLEVAGIPRGASRLDVLRRLGEPRDVLLDPEAQCVFHGACEKYFYPGLIFTFDGATGIRSGVELTDPTYATRRGLRVGQGSKEALALYGRPKEHGDDYLGWFSLSASVQVILVKGEISRIWLQK
jgi:hypothetical protein